MSYFMRNAREPISSYTHFLGAVFFGAGALLLLIKCLLQEGPAGRTVLSLAVFGFSLVALYSASAIYHFSCASARMVRILRKLDHSMIYVLIAGTYTPVLLAYMPMPNAAYFTAFMWLLALAGILIKLLWFSAPRWLGTAFYLIMGWAILADPSVFWQMSGGAFALLAAGGLSYTAGGIIYGLQKPNFSESFGHHELFHLFCLAGSLFHYLLMLLYVA